MSCRETRFFGGEEWTCLLSFVLGTVLPIAFLWRPEHDGGRGLVAKLACEAEEWLSSAG